MNAIKQLTSFFGRHNTGKIKKSVAFRQQYDMQGLRRRIIETMIKTGKTEDDVSDLLGIDPSLPVKERLAQWPAPSMELVAILSNYLGASVPFLLTGKVENEVDRLVSGQANAPGNAIENVAGSSVIQDVTQSNITVQNFSGDGLLSQTEVEVIKILRRLPPRQKARAITTLLELAE